MRPNSLTPRTIQLLDVALSPPGSGIYTSQLHFGLKGQNIPARG